MSLPIFPHPPSDRTLIIGSGIVGSHLASFLSTTLGSKVILIDNDIKGLPGSTGHAPGFIGQYNELPVLTELAKRSVDHYSNGVEGGFQRVGGLEVLHVKEEGGEEGEEGLKRRAECARSAGLEVKLLDKSQVLDIAPPFIRPEYLPSTGNAGLLFPNDGTANAILLTHSQQEQAAKNGAILINAKVLSHSRSISSTSTQADNGIGEGDGLWDVNTSIGSFQVGKIVYCTGIFASQLLPHLEHSVVSVSHPYSYSTLHSPRSQKTPFIRWPSKHVYARDHSTRDGLGSYAHPPIKVPREKHTESAYGEWEESFDGVLKEGYDLLPEETARTFDAATLKDATTHKDVEGSMKFNGSFSVTPDGLPLSGKVQEDLYCAVGIWVTHAAGTAKLLGDEILGEARTEDEWLRKALDPNRFNGAQSDEDKLELERRALGKYNDIYNKGE